MTKNLFITPLLLLILAGCTTPNQFEVAEYNQLLDNPHPPLSIYRYQNNPEFREECHAYDQQSILHHCILDQLSFSKIQSEFIESGQFQQVNLGGNQSDYQLYLSIAGYNHEGGEEIGQAALAGATLLLLPMSVSANIKVDALLSWQGFELKRYRYDLPFTSNVSLLTANQDTDGDVAKMVASHLIKDFQEEDTFSSEFLLSSINASNYKENLKTPDAAGAYLKTNEHLYHHPFQGLQSRYTHSDFPVDYIDSFVYPVRHWEIEDVELSLEREIQNIKDDIEIYARTYELKELVFNESELRRNVAEFPAIYYLKGTYQGEDGISYATYVYLGMQKDKLVKLRSTVEIQNDEVMNRVEASFELFAQEYFEMVDVPDESLFMLKLRKEWRNMPEAESI